MLFLGIIDIICLTACADIPGLLSITGTAYCDAPLFFYVLGSVAMANRF